MYAKTASPSFTPAMTGAIAPTQQSVILKHLEAGKPITQGHSTLVYGISRLSSCICRLRDEGHEIDSVIKFDEVGKQYAEYRLRRDITMNAVVQVKPGHGIGLPTWVRKNGGGKVVGLANDAVYVQFEGPQGPKTSVFNERELTRV